MRRIGALLQENGVTYAEVLPYNKMAGSKYAMVGQTYRPTFDEQLEPQPREFLMAEYGVSIHIL